MTHQKLASEKPRPRPRKAPRIAPLILVLASSLALLSAIRTAEAQESAEGAPTSPSSEAAIILKKRFFVGGIGGFALVSATHPELGTTRLRGPVIGLQAGYSLSPRWVISADVTNFETTLRRASQGEVFTTSSSWLRPLAGCETCQPRPRGGYVVGTTMHLTSLSPRIEVTPFGPDGLYVGASAGIAFVGGLDARTGASGTARLGFRYRPLRTLTVAAEGGAQGQAYSDASAAMYFAAAQARLHF